MNKLVFILILLISTLLIFGCISDNVVSVSKDKECSDRNYYSGCAVPVLNKSTYYSAPVTSSIKCTSTDGDVIFKVQYGGGPEMADVPYFYFNGKNEFVTQCGGGPDFCSLAESFEDLNKCNAYCMTVETQWGSRDNCLASCKECLPKKKDACDIICEKFPDCCY